jgi:hypothetical protein
VTESPNRFIEKRKFGSEKFRISVAHQVQVFGKRVLRSSCLRDLRAFVMLVHVLR